MISKRIVLHFPHLLVDKPIVYRLVKDYDLVFNILKAYITPEEEGLLVIELSGENENYKKAVEYLQDIGVKIQPLNQDITKNDSRCTNCNVCVPLCPSGALLVDSVSRNVTLCADKCIACGLCVNACPTKAIEIIF